MTRILVLEPRQHHEEWQVVLGGHVRDVVVRVNRESLVTALADRRPDVLVYVVTDLAEDLRLLREIRRLSPMLPIILLDGPMGLEARRSVQELKPTYYGVLPLESSEICDAVHGALHRNGRR